MEYKAIEVKSEIEAQAIYGVVEHEAIREAIILSAIERKDVLLSHNTKTFRISYQELIRNAYVAPNSVDVSRLMETDLRTVSYSQIKAERGEL